MSNTILEQKCPEHGTKNTSQTKFNFEKGSAISTFAFVDCHDLQNYFELLGWNALSGAAK